MLALMPAVLPRTNQYRFVTDTSKSANADVSNFTSRRLS